MRTEPSTRFILMTITKKTTTHRYKAYGSYFTPEARYKVPKEWLIGRKFDIIFSSINIEIPG